MRLAESMRCGDRWPRRPCVPHLTLILSAPKGGEGNWRKIHSSFASSVISAFSTFDTGQPAFAAAASS